MTAPAWSAIGPTVERARGSHRELESLGLVHERDQLASAWRDALDTLGVNVVDDEREVFLVAAGVHLITRLIAQARELTGIADFDELVTITLAGLADYFPEAAR